MNVSGWLAAQSPSSESRNLENPSNPLDPWPDPAEAFGGNLASSGVRVTRTKALGLAALFRGVNLLASTVAKLPLGVYRHMSPGREIDPDHFAHRLLARRPNEAMTPYVWKQTLQAHAVLDGGGYSYIDRAESGRPLALLILDPNRTYPVRENGRLWYVHELPNNERRKIDPTDILHFKGWGYDGLIGYNVFTKARESLGENLAKQGFGSTFFRNSARPNVVIQVPNRLSPEARRNLRESWERMHAGLDNAHKTAILEEQAQIKELSINARDSQLLESREFGIREIANWIGVPPHKLGDHSATSYGSLEQENQSFLDDSVDPWLVGWEEECNEKLLTEWQKVRDTHSVAFDRFPLVRADIAARGAFYTSMVLNGIMCPDEARARENLNPRADGRGAVYYLPSGVTIAGGEEEAGNPGGDLIDLDDVRQALDYDCGPAAVQAVCEFWEVGPSNRQDYLDGLGTTATRGTTPAAILAFASRQGLVATAGAMETDDLARLFAAGQPILCPIQADPTVPSSGHWVVVIGVGMGQVFLHDPAAGRRMLSVEDWEAGWHDTDADGVPYDHYGIALGDDLPIQPPEEAPSPEGQDPEGDDPPAPGPDVPGGRMSQVHEAHRAILREAVERILTRLSVHTGKAAAKPASFLRCLDALHADHGDVIRRMLTPPLLGISALGESIDATATAAALVDEIRTALLDLSGTCTGDVLAVEVGRLFETLGEDVRGLKTFQAIFSEA